MDEFIKNDHKKAVLICERESCWAYGMGHLSMGEADMFRLMSRPRTLTAGI